jgi:glucosylglycerate phosphorylase
VPGIYFHSLFGSRGWPEGVAQSGRNRTINRQKLDLAVLEADLADPRSLRAQVFGRYARLLRARAASPAFHPNGDQQVIPLGDALFALLRTAPDRSAAVLCLQNVSDRPQTARGIVESSGMGKLCDLLTGRKLQVGRDGAGELAPYQTLWLAGESLT